MKDNLYHAYPFFIFLQIFSSCSYVSYLEESLEWLPFYFLDSLKVALCFDDLSCFLISQVVKIPFISSIFNVFKYFFYFNVDTFASNFSRRDLSTFLTIVESSIYSLNPLTEFTISYTLRKNVAIFSTSSI